MDELVNQHYLKKTGTVCCIVPVFTLALCHRERKVGSGKWGVGSGCR
jgi:hypothetical protein